MCRDIKFRVWSEFEIDGKLHKVMDGPESWFLLTQTGKLMSHGPMSFNPNVAQQCKKLIPMFFTGLKDKKRTREHPEGQEIYEDDVVVFYNPVLGEKYEDRIKNKIKVTIFNLQNLSLENRIRLEVIGNIHENPELLKDQNQPTQP